MMTAKRFTTDYKDFLKEDMTFIKNNGKRMTFQEIVDLLNELHEEKEFWKSNCCTQDNFNSILLNELSIAQEQGYKLSDPFKKLMEEKEDLE